MVDVLVTFVESEMSQYEVEISPSSRVVLFQGNLRKAPQLNKRGRKKWKERFCALRANKTLECFKSKKAMESSKNPRKMIDLRECINLEVGLEYKDQQHIFSLGTFKRTFFFGAPSDALMLQWVDCIEKVKNANDKESIKFLDIGLRKSSAAPIMKMKTSQSLSKLAALSSSIPNISSIGSQKVMNGHLMKKKDFNRNDKRSPSLPPASSSTEPANSLKWVSSASSSTETSPNHAPKYKSEQGSSSTETSPKHAQLYKYEQKESSDEESLPRRHYYVNVSPRPPANKKSSKTASSLAASWVTTARRQWSPEEHLQLRSSMPPEVGHKVPPPKFPTRKRSVGNEENNPFCVLLQKEQVQTIQEKLSPLKVSSSASESSNSGKLGMKRSFRYRQITLKKEKPLLMDVEEEPSTDEEETEDEEGRPAGIKQLYGKKEFARSSPNLTELGVAPPNKCNKSPLTQLTTCNYGVTQQTNYSKVTVVGVKVQNCPAHNIKGSIAMSNQTGGQMLSPGRSSAGLRLSSSEETLISSSNRCSSPVEACENDTVILPDRHPSDTFMNCDSISISSLDDILVDPPEMFDDSISNSQSGLGKEHKDNTKFKPNGDDVVNRNSTESNDTGYNSSPGYSQSKNTVSEKNWSRSEEENETLAAPVEKSYTCVPIVFYSKNVWKPKGKGKGLLGLQVCLVEQKSSVVNELLSLKELEGYKVIECEQEHGLSGMKSHTGDTMVVETSLEDLEFGFSVVKSTQKDLFNRKVREFSFEVRNLFSSNRKPFSCEVHIKHASEVIVLPIEVTG